MTSTPQDDPRPPFTRRTVLRGAAGGAVTLPVLAACAAGGSQPAGSGGSGSAAGRGQALVSTADVPVGGGTILDAQQVVVTQPVEGEFKAFSAICTHSQCLVGSISDGEIRCPCHNSLYSIDDGSVLGGPAPRPLPPVAVTVKSGEVVRS
jgi:nitrite reductase/ring-hydroxylating ferredoxin subunit